MQAEEACFFLFPDDTPENKISDRQVKSLTIGLSVLQIVFVLLNECEVLLILLHLSEHLLVIAVGSSDAVLDTSVPQSNSLLDVILGVVVLLDNKEHLF